MKDNDLLDADFDFIDIMEIEELGNTDNLDQNYDDYGAEGDLTQLIKERK